MWQCECQSPVHDTSVKLQTIMELKQLKEGVTNANGKRIFISLFEIPESAHLESLPVKCPATVNVCLS